MRWKGKTGLVKSYPSRLMPHHVSYKRLNLVRYLDTNICLIAVFSLSTISADLKLFFSLTKEDSTFFIPCISAVWINFQYFPIKFNASLYLSLMRTHNIYLHFRFNFQLFFDLLHPHKIQHIRNLNKHAL